ncbi:hypothetical protein MSG28_005235 [Choristoneura fumiferana]|uniref:Uncharacterized protein n=1 Tax=Choristoneura fumiferana TaxID=7141 RepID=A0ACC0JQI3_CHOFU|nr:hypothetical protein MSG28_005235 [Choristoneura fumiferana]
MSTRKILIGGGTGFIGRRLGELLSKNGYDVKNVARMPATNNISWSILEASGLPKNTCAVVNCAGQQFMDFTKAWSPGGLLVSALRVRSGHIPLNCFLHLMRVVQSPLCMGCDKTEDLIHFLVECDQNKEIRVRRSDANLQIHWTGLCIQRRGFSARESVISVFSVVYISEAPHEADIVTFGVLKPRVTSAWREIPILRHKECFEIHSVNLLFRRFKQNVQNSRVYTTKALAKAINKAQDKPKVYVVVTGVGAYEPSDSRRYDEGSSTTGSDFFSKLVIEWEKAAQVDPPVRLYDPYWTIKTQSTKDCMQKYSMNLTTRYPIGEPDYKALGCGFDPQSGSIII